MNHMLAILSLSFLPLLLGCTSTTSSTVPQHSDSLNSVAMELASYPTPDLQARQAQVLETIAEIQREVELKAGLHMGVLIRDERARLGDLYREAQQIQRELSRRATAQADGSAEIHKARL